MGKKGHGGVKQESEGDCAARLITIVFCLEREMKGHLFWEYKISLVMYAGC